MTAERRFSPRSSSAAEARAAAEKDFRREATERIKALEQERAFAFRRLI